MRNMLAALMLISCAHVQHDYYAARITDGSDHDRDHLWVCAPDPQHPGDLRCLSMRKVLNDHPELRPCGGVEDDDEAPAPIQRNLNGPATI